MALWAINRVHLVLRLNVEQPIHAEGWRTLFDCKQDRNCDGEIIAIDARAGSGVELAEVLTGAGFNGPSKGAAADFVFVSGQNVLSYEKPDWFEVTTVTFFDPNEEDGSIWKLKDSEKYKMFGQRQHVHHKGYTCDWQPFIGKINTK